MLLSLCAKERAIWVGSAPRRNAQYSTVYLSFVRKCNFLLNKKYPTVQLRFIAILAIGY